MILTPATRARIVQFHATPGLRLGLPSYARYAGFRRREFPLHGLAVQGII